ncbi:MAG TPA: DUF3341 domain-containing protein [Hyphomicrobiaceae bacterium]|jgi:hypothetical protein
MTNGIVLSFSSEAALRDAVERFEAQQVGPLETYSPLPVAGAGEDRTVPSVMLVGGLLGAALGFGMETYANTAGYPLDIGGRPEFSWPSFVPIAFEIGVLFAILAAILAFFAVARMLELYEPVDECSSMRDAMRDKWVLAVRTPDANVLTRAREAANKLRPLAVEEIPP